MEGMEIYLVKEISEVKSDRTEEYNTHILKFYSSKDRAEREVQKIMEKRLVLFKDWKALRDEKTGRILKLRKVSDNGWIQEQYLSISRHFVDDTQD